LELQKTTLTVSKILLLQLLIE